MTYIQTEYLYSKNLICPDRLKIHYREKYDQSIEQIDNGNMFIEIIECATESNNPEHLL